MPSIPLFISGLPVLAFAPLAAPLQSAMGTIAGRAICRDAEGGFLLFGCDGEWQAVTDTWHETVDDALRQAEYEHEGMGLAWTWPDGRPG